MSPPKRPTREEIEAAAGKKVADVIKPGLRVLFCGINPGLYTAAVGHHFAWPSNRFWPALYAAGFTDRLLSPDEERLLLDYGYGITNVVERASRGAADLTAEEMRQGARQLEEKVRRYRPQYLAVLGISVYRQAFHRPKAAIGPQPEPFGGAKLWALPNPSGLNAHYQLEDLADLYRRLRLAAEAQD